MESLCYSANKGSDDAYDVSTSLTDPAGDDMDDDLLDEANPPATQRKGEFGAIQVPTNKQEFQQWTAGLDRVSVRQALSHFQALNEQHEREDHARQAEAVERASASGTVGNG